MEANAEGPEYSPSQLLTPQQRAAVLAYGRLGDQRLVADELGIAMQTVKNHLSDAYRRLGVESGPQAIYMLMGGAQAALAVPEASNDIRGLRRRVEVLERQLSEAESTVQAYAAIERARQEASAPAADPGYIPLMTDGEISLAQLKAWAQRFDRDAGSTTEMRVSSREWVWLLGYYTQPRGSGMVAGP